LFQALPYPLKVGVKVKGSAFFEGHLNLDGGEGRGDTTPGNRLDEGSPDIRTKEWGGNMGVADVEQGGGEGLEGVGFLGREIDNLCRWKLSAETLKLGNQKNRKGATSSIYSLVGEMDTARAALYRQGLVALVTGGWCQRQAGAGR
jgi:hypothetical protein